MGVKNCRCLVRVDVSNFDSCEQIQNEMRNLRLFWTSVPCIRSPCMGKQEHAEIQVARICPGLDQQEEEHGRTDGTDGDTAIQWLPSSGLADLRMLALRKGDNALIAPRWSLVGRGPTTVPSLPKVLLVCLE